MIALNWPIRFRFLLRRGPGESISAALPVFILTTLFLIAFEIPALNAQVGDKADHEPTARESWLHSVTTYKYGNARTGQNTQETTLTPLNVNVRQFGKLFSVPVDGSVYAQILYVSHLDNIAGGTHNVLFAVTENDSLYAIDAADGSILWRQSFVDVKNGILPVDTADVDCKDIAPEIGITSTPVIDLTTKTIYLVTKSKEKGSFVQRLHALDLGTHAEKFGGPVVIAATVKGNGIGSRNGQITFNPLRQLNRPGLLLQNGHIVIAWGSHCDVKPYHGWIMSYNASSLKQEAVFSTTSNGDEGGVWMSGDGVASDANGNLFFATGNGTYDGAVAGDYGDSILKLELGTNGQLRLADWFTPFNQETLNDEDLDLGSGGVLLLPDLPPGYKHQHELIQMGKGALKNVGGGGTIYLIDRDDLGKYCAGCSRDTQIVQEISGASDGIWGSPAYWNGFVYWGGGSHFTKLDSVKAWSFNSDGRGLLSASPTSITSETFSYPTLNPVISANGNNDGLLWLVANSTNQRDGAQILYAYDALNLQRMLYNSNQAANGRDRAGGVTKFVVPTVVNGRVYVGGDGSITVFGLLGSR